MRINKLVVKENISQLGSIAKQILPKGKIEFILFAFLTFFYLSYSVYIALNTSILDHSVLRYDLFFSFDNVVLSGVGFENVEGHPLLPFYSKPLIVFGNWLGIGWGMKLRTLLFLVLCVMAIALSCVYVYRYLKNVLFLDNFAALLFTSFYSIFSTNLILCFTTETFTVSAFLLTFLVYIYSDYIRRNKAVRFSTHFVFSFLLGGLTITNYSKVVALMLFTKERLLSLLLKILLIGGLFLAYFHSLGIWDSFTRRMGILHTALDEGSFFEKIVSYSYGGSILFPSIAWKANPLKPNETMISLDLYSSWWQYAFVGILITLILIAIYKNHKEKLLQALVLVFSVDVFLHTILKLGVEESFIYGGHWVYVVPLFLGWLYKRLNSRSKRVLLSLTCCLFLIVAINNTIAMIDFIELAKEKFPVSESFTREQFH